VVSHIIERLEEKLGEMSVIRGDKHNFLGMDVQFKGDGTIHISSKTYITECIESFSEEMFGRVLTPVNDKLFEVDKTSP